MNPLDIARLRLRGQLLTGKALNEPAEVVAWLGAVQAQDYAGAKWALGLRLSGAADETVEQAFTEGAILRTHILRPTWHFVTPADIRWLLALTAPRVHAANGTWYRQLELNSALFKQCNTALARALEGGRNLTREELRPVLQQAGINPKPGLRMSYLMMQAELDGIVCSGPRRGKQFTYALLDERAPYARRLGREEALAELAGRFFFSRGPATVHDFAKWSGLTVADARRGLEAVKAQLQHEAVGDQVLWFSTDTPARREIAPTAFLLSIYDEYVSGYKDRSAIITRENGAKLKAMGSALTAIVVADGQIVGTWKRTIRKNEVVIAIDLFRPLAKPQNRAVAAAALRYGKFLGLPVRLEEKLPTEF